jgi:hypothetical protein
MFNPLRGIQQWLQKLPEWELILIIQEIELSRHLSAGRRMLFLRFHPETVKES